jgi:hypothetical protein
MGGAELSLQVVSKRKTNEKQTNDRSSLRLAIHTFACRVTNLSAAFSSVSIFLQNAKRVTDRPSSARE